MSETYSHGHHPSVLRSHTWRTVENSAAYLVPHLRPGLRVLDVGCGPGTITVELADRVAPGDVVGIDASTEIVTMAGELVADGTHPNASFRTGDAYALDVPDASVDVVHAHQVLQHLAEPVRTLREWRRVLVPGGIVAARDSDYAAMVWSPDDPALDQWRTVVRDLARRNGGQLDAGRYLLGWACDAGFDDVTFTSSTWTFADPTSREWWGDLWAERCLHSAFADQCLAYELAGRDELESFASAFRRWAQHPDAVFVTLHGEIIARV